MHHDGPAATPASILRSFKRPCQLTNPNDYRGISLPLSPLYDSSGASCSTTSITPISNSNGTGTVTTGAASCTARTCKRLTAASGEASKLALLRRQQADAWGSPAWLVVACSGPQLLKQPRTAAASKAKPCLANAVLHLKNKIEISNSKLDETTRDIGHSRDVVYSVRSSSSYYKWPQLLVLRSSSLL